MKDVHGTFNPLLSAVSPSAMFSAQTGAVLLWTDRPALRDVSLFSPAPDERRQQQEVHASNIKYAACHIQYDEHLQQMAS